MPTILEVATYELGIRLVQFDRLLIDCGEESLDQARSPSGLWVAWVNHGIDLLETAFRQWARTADLNSVRFDGGVGLIQQLRPLWNDDWSKRVGYEFSNELERSPLADNSKQVKDLIERACERLSNEHPAAGLWFAIGQGIVRAYYDIVSVGVQQSEPGTGNAGRIQRPPSADRGWIWRHKDQLDDHLAQVQCNWADLCPQIPAGAQSKAVARLPYDNPRYEIWLRVELGLNQLHRGMSEAADGSPIEAPVAESAPATSSIPRIKQAIRERVTVDIDHLTITVDGVPTVLSDKACAVYLESLAEANGNPVSMAAIKKRHPTVKGLRPDRVWKKLPEPIQQIVIAEAGAGSHLKLA